MREYPAARYMIKKTQQVIKSPWVDEGYIKETRKCLDNIDLDFAKKRNIRIYKTQTTPAPAVAELTLGLILNLMRKISEQNHQLKNGIWKKQMGELLTGKTLGIVGMGNIGKQLVKIL